MSKRQMALVGFLQAQNCSNYPASWRHPESATDFMSARYYQDIARTLEAGKFHMAFFDDRLAMPDRYGMSADESLKNGVRVVKMDPIPILSMMGAVTSKLGLGATASTTYYEPFHVARQFSTLDHMTDGRAAWNVVTSLNDSEAANYGQDALLGHDDRYERADEFMDVVHGHWDTWADDAIIMDKANGIFADPTKVKALKHVGKYFKSRGPFTVPPTPQGRPVIIQAGQSGRGRDFAIKWAELIFAIFPNLEFAQRVYKEMQEVAAAAGRDPSTYRLTPAAYAVIGESQGEAEDKAGFIADLHQPIDTLALLSEALNYDFAAKGMDEAFSSDELAAISGLQAIRDRVVRLSGKDNPTVRDFVEHSARGTLKEMAMFVGTANQVADGMEEWFTGGGCDGFVLAATHMPGAYEDFVQHVVPELQRRGVYHKDYAGTTLRENLGLA
ncbi:MAG: LLM class flavin-dependent oxidoreductase [Alphaproteobacteria bacterium]